MVYKILIRARDRFNNLLVEYEARNLQSFSYDVTIPTQQMALPEFFIQDAILTKAEGNTGKMVFTWVIKDEDTTPFNTLTSWKDMWQEQEASANDLPHTLSVPSNRLLYYSRKLKDLATGNESPSVGAAGEEVSTTGNTAYDAGIDTKTADGQMIAFSEVFEKRGMSTREHHQVILRNATDNYNIWLHEGVISRLSFQKAATDPVTWNATVELTIGDVILSSP